MQIRYFGGDEQDGNVFVVETRAAGWLVRESHSTSTRTRPCW